jgi:hypothetical protein
MHLEDRSVSIGIDFMPYPKGDFLPLSFEALSLMYFRRHSMSNFSRCVCIEGSCHDLVDQDCMVWNNPSVVNHMAAQACSLKHLKAS